MLHAYTQEPFLLENFAPFALRTSQPSWWKSLPVALSLSERADFPADLAMTARSCFSLQNLFHRALVLPAWSDMIISTAIDGSVQVMSPLGLISHQHPKAQYAGMMADRVQCKIISPWLFSFHDQTAFLITQPFYHLPRRSSWEVMPGLLEFCYQNNSHINLAIDSTPLQDCRRINIGDPLAYLIPLSADEITVEPCLLSSDEFERSQSPMKRAFHHRKLRKRLGVTLKGLMGRAYE